MRTQEDVGRIGGQGPEDEPSSWRTKEDKTKSGGHLFQENSVRGQEDARGHGENRRTSGGRNEISEDEKGHKKVPRGQVEDNVKGPSPGRGKNVQGLGSRAKDSTSLPLSNEPQIFVWEVIFGAKVLLFRASYLGNLNG